MGEKELDRGNVANISQMNRFKIDECGKKTEGSLFRIEKPAGRTGIEPAVQWRYDSRISLSLPH